MLRSAPFRGASYLALPAGLVKHQLFLLNICNYENDKCFFYCFVAEFHRQKTIAITLKTIRRDQEDKWTYYNKEQNSRTHEPIFELLYHMGVPAIFQFEVLNDVQMNVFRLDSELKFEVIINNFFLYQYKKV